MDERLAEFLRAGVLVGFGSLAVLAISDLITTSLVKMFDKDLKKFYLVRGTILGVLGLGAILLGSKIETEKEDLDWAVSGFAGTALAYAFYDFITVFALQFIIGNKTS